jgi:MFS family permease
VFFPGLIVGRLFDIGYFRVVFMSATTLLVLVTFLIAQCTEYWHFLLCQGLGVGVRFLPQGFSVFWPFNYFFALQLMCGTIYAPVTPLINHWFKKKIGLAMGVSAVGSSIGGAVFPIITRKLILRVGCDMDYCVPPTHPLTIPRTN